MGLAGQLPKDIDDYDCFTCGELFCKHGQCLKCGEFCDNCAEAAYESWLDNFYGSDTPQTDRERSITTWEEKQKLHG